MRKVLVVLMLVVMVFLLSACNEKASEESNKYGFFVSICDYDRCHLMYDPFTKVVYIHTYGDYQSGLSPYYTVKFGEPVVARYGINWTESDLQ